MEPTTGENGHRSPNSRWTKVHFIYFLLATFDVLAVSAGLYLSNEFASIFNRTIAFGEEWDQSFVQVWQLNGLADSLGVPTLEVFDSHNPVGESRKFETALREFQTKLAVIKGRFIASGKADIAGDALKAFVGVESILQLQASSSRMVFSNYYNGWIAASAQSLSQADRYSKDLRQQLNVAISKIRFVKGQYELRSSQEVRRLQEYEVLIGLSIGLMVCAVTVYGLYVGQLMRRKYRELLTANEKLNSAQEETMAFAQKLQCVNENVTSLNRELAESMKRLEEAQEDIIRKGKLAQLGQLTATVAHEIRNPLSTVRTAAFLIARKTSGSALDIGTQLDRINNGIVRCDNIITELLDFARTRSLQRAVVDVDEWVGKVVAEQVGKLPRMLTINCRLKLGGLKASFDADRMQRVLINLLSNASEAMVGRGDDPTAFATTTPMITIETNAMPRGVEIWCTDNGPGISVANLKKIRDPLFTTKSFGVGLGLPAVEKILDQHGGGLEIISSEGAGTTMKAWFPIDNEKKAA